LTEENSSESEHDEQPLVIKMLESMLAVKKTVEYRLQQNMLLPSAEAIADEVRRYLMSFKRASQIEEIVKADYDRVLKC
jgi:hypothetical protein